MKLISNSQLKECYVAERVFDFDGDIPDPKSFPLDKDENDEINYEDFASLPEYPNLITNGFIADLSVLECDRHYVLKAGRKITNSESIQNLLDIADKKCVNLLPRPEFIEGKDLTKYLWEIPSGILGLQCKYYNYFKNRYPECKFYYAETPNDMIAVKYNSAIVGFLMPCKPHYIAYSHFSSKNTL